MCVYLHSFSFKWWFSIGNTIPHGRAQTLESLFQLFQAPFLVEWPFTHKLKERLLLLPSHLWVLHPTTNQEGKDWQLNSWQDLISCQSQLWYLVNVTGVLLEPVQENEGRTNTFSIAVRRCALVLYTKNCKSRASWPRAPQLNSFTIKQLPSSLALAPPPRLTHSPKPFNPFWNINNSRLYISDKVLVEWPWHASCVHMKAGFFLETN